eukprot:351969-Chlamydomonas_euryale.AAC.2
MCGYVDVYTDGRTCGCTRFAAPAGATYAARSRASQRAVWTARRAGRRRPRRLRATAAAGAACQWCRPHGPGPSHAALRVPVPITKCGQVGGTDKHGSVNGCGTWKACRDVWMSRPYDVILDVFSGRHLRWWMGAVTWPTPSVVVCYIDVWRNVWMRAAMCGRVGQGGRCAGVARLCSHADGPCSYSARPLPAVRPARPLSTVRPARPLSTVQLSESHLAQPLLVLFFGVQPAGFPVRRKAAARVEGLWLRPRARTSIAERPRASREANCSQASREAN